MGPDTPQHLAEMIEPEAAPLVVCDVCGVEYPADQVGSSWVNIPDSDISQEDMRDRCASCTTQHGPLALPPAGGVRDGMARKSNQLISDEMIERAILKPGESLPPKYSGYALDGTNQDMTLYFFESGELVKQAPIPQPEAPIRRR